MSPAHRKHRAGKRGKSERSTANHGASTKKSPRRTPKRAAKKSLRRKTISSAPSKATLRATLRAKRVQLPPSDQRIASERVATNLVATRAFLVSRRIACYLSSDGEIDPSGIIERIWGMHKKAYLPVLSRLIPDRLWFAPATPGMGLAPNRYGIPEPRVRASELVRARELDLILLPVVAFDDNGNRLGRGAGFYDRSLAFLHYRRFLRSPVLLGLAHEFQRVPKLATDPWDVPLDGIVTDRGVYYTIP